MTKNILLDVTLAFTLVVAFISLTTWIAEPNQTVSAESPIIPTCCELKDVIYTTLPPERYDISPTLKDERYTDQEVRDYFRKDAETPYKKAYNK